MLYSAFCKLKIEAENEADAMAHKQPELLVDEANFTATSYVVVGNLLTVQLALRFFT